MILSLFIDSDILFNLLAINKEKEDKLNIKGTTGDPELDKLLKATDYYSQKYDEIFLSSLSVLEILCTLNRLNSGFKVPTILKKITLKYKILQIPENVIYLAWFIGSKFKMHSGDAIHVSFCLINEINGMLVKDKELFDSLTLMQNNIDRIISEKQAIKYFENTKFKEVNLVKLEKALKHLKSLEIKKLE